MPGEAASVRTYPDLFTRSEASLSGASAIAFAIRAGLNLVLATLRFGKVPK